MYNATISKPKILDTPIFCPILFIRVGHMSFNYLCHENENQILIPKNSHKKLTVACFTDNDHHEI